MSRRGNYNRGSRGTQIGRHSKIKTSFLGVKKDQQLRTKWDWFWAIFPSVLVIGLVILLVAAIGNRT